MIVTSKHSKESALCLGDMLDCKVYNIYTGEVLRPGRDLPRVYNMGTTAAPEDSINSPLLVAVCVNKLSTFNQLGYMNVLTVPYTKERETAQDWLEEDKIVVNRLTATGKANEGLEYSYCNAPDIRDKPLNLNAKFWTRYVNHTRELRAYCFKSQPTLVFEKVYQRGGTWAFVKVPMPRKLQEQIRRAKIAFSGMNVVAFDILECVTGDFYFLEANSAPSLLVHDSILPDVVKEIKNVIN